MDPLLEKKPGNGLHVGRCGACAKTRVFASLAARDVWASEHAKNLGHTVVTWEEPYLPGWDSVGEDVA